MEKEREKIELEKIKIIEGRDGIDSKCESDREREREREMEVESNQTKKTVREKWTRRERYY